MAKGLRKNNRRKEEVEKVLI